ncbi:rod shape-determining protein [Lysinibacillus sp. M3]|uniref:Cell shape-determining protein MreB n=1 Tax=Lysinibacillus zambalensis TaxID=3160866 RepID=A0ABV1ML09_9BACI
MFKYRGTAVGIDLGTANLLMYIKGKGITVREPSIITIDVNKKEIVATGQKAKDMIGRTHSGLQTIRPIRDGVIADYESTTLMIQHYLKQAVSKGIFATKPTLVISVPSNITSVEKRAVIDAAIQGGARDAHIVEESFAAAIGASLPVWEPTGSMIVDIGGGTTEVAVISLGGIVISTSCKVAGDEMDRLIIQHIRKEYQLLIGEPTAEKIKINLFNEELSNRKSIRGRDLVTGLPRTIEITDEEIWNVLIEPIEIINQTIRHTLENTPPELAADIMERGLILTGGVAQLRGLDTVISNATNLPVIVSDDPLDCVVKGTAKVLENVKILK